MVLIAFFHGVICEWHRFQLNKPSFVCGFPKHLCSSGSRRFVDDVLFVLLLAEAQNSRGLVTSTLYYFVSSLICFRLIRVLFVFSRCCVSIPVFELNCLHVLVCRTTVGCITCTSRVCVWHYLVTRQQTNEIKVMINRALWVIADAWQVNYVDKIAFTQWYKISSMDNTRSLGMYRSHMIQALQEIYAHAAHLLIIHTIAIRSWFRMSSVSFLANYAVSALWCADWWRCLS